MSPRYSRISRRRNHRVVTVMRFTDFQCFDGAREVRCGMEWRRDEVGRGHHYRGGGILALLFSLDISASGKSIKYVL